MPSSARVLYFDAPKKVSVRTEALAAPLPHQVQITTLVSAISPGTEMLFYRGQIPDHMAADASIAGLTARVTYPLRYGYACVGEVTRVGEQCDSAWLNRRVFAFQPHTSHFNCSPDDLLPVPSNVDTEAAALFPNMETAVSLVHDAAPRTGERFAIFGQGIVGLLTAWLLARHPLETLAVVDPITNRRSLGRTLGAHAGFQPDAVSALTALNPDCILELTGNPKALESAVTIAGYHARIIIGSWYGNKQVSLPLGHDFHRNRITIYSSQVSSLPAHLSARWDKSRRYATAWRLLAQFPHQQVITHRYPFYAAGEAYPHVDQAHPDTCQVLFTYDSG